MQKLLFPIFVVFITSCFLPMVSSAVTYVGSAVLTNTIEEIECEVTINDVSGNIHFRLVGPADRWFGFAFGTSTMAGYTLIANSSDGTLVERDMNNPGDPGSLHSIQNLTNITTSINAGRITLEADRMNVTGDPLDYIFITPPSTLNTVYAVRSSANTSFGYHGSGQTFRGETPLVFTPLPIQLSRFNLSVEGNVGVLTWATEAEINSLGFEVERSHNAEEWTKLGFVEGQGNSSTFSHYSFRDEDLLPGPNYYRIKMLDLDGSFEYSEIRSIDFQGPGINDNILIQPNPVISMAKFEALELFEGKARIMIYSSSFQKVREIFWAESSESLEVDLSNLASGPYFVIIKHREWSSVLKIVKAR